MTNLDIFGKSCNRWPGHSRCLRSVHGNACTAETRENGKNYYVKCESGQKRRGTVPVELILLLKENISPCCRKKLFFASRIGALCCPECVENDYCPICKESIDVRNWICECTRNGIMMPSINENNLVGALKGGVKSGK